MKIEELKAEVKKLGWEVETIETMANHKYANLLIQKRVVELTPVWEEYPRKHKEWATEIIERIKGCETSEIPLCDYFWKLKNK